MTLQNLYWLAVLFGGLAVLFMITTAILRHIGHNRSANQMTVDITVMSKKATAADTAHTETKPTNPWLSAADTMVILVAALCGATIISIAIFSYYNSMALRHGAFDDYQTTETIASIKDRSAHGFIDQSKQLPDDLSGNILIFFKYTCNDCYDTHDQIMAVLERENVTNVYFISSRSDIAETLIEAYDVEAVPWGVYIGNNGSVQITDILYNEFETVPSEKFIEENLMTIINAQKEDIPS